MLIDNQDGPAAAEALKPKSSIIRRSRRISSLIERLEPVRRRLDIYSSIRFNSCMAGSDKRRFKNELYDQFGRLAKAMASGRRLELIDLLAQGPRTVESLALETEQSVANTSQHLQVLRQGRLVETTRRGNHIHYRLADDHVQIGRAHV